jgi:hypothetical protein
MNGSSTGAKSSKKSRRVLRGMRGDIILTRESDEASFGGVERSTRSECTSISVADLTAEPA